VSKIWGHKKGKIKNHSSVIFHPYAGRDASLIALNFGMRGDIADVIAHAKFYVNRFRGFGVLTTPVLPFYTVALATV